MDAPSDQLPAREPAQAPAIFTMHTQSEDARDAARYRWLRDVAQSQDWEWLGHSTTPITTDSAIDGLMQTTHPVRSAGG